MSDSKQQFKNMPPIDEWPDWAQWCAMDLDGHWWWFGKEPYIQSTSWDVGTIFTQPVPNIEPEENRHLWRKSLTKRPTE